MTKAEKFQTYTPNRKSTKFRSMAKPIRSMAKPKTTGITQRVGEVIQSNYGVGAPQQMQPPVSTGNNNDGGIEDKIGFRSIYKNPVYLILVVVVLGSLIFAFKK